MTLNVTAVNQTPVGTAKTVSMSKNGTYTFAAIDFGFTDPHDAPPNSFLAVKITTLPTLGTLSDDGVPVTAGQYVSVADITAQKLVFTPPAPRPGTVTTSFTFQVQDDGGTANGGIDTDLTPRKLTISVS